MRNGLKYITLLIFGGVIIPICHCTPSSARVNTPASITALKQNPARDGGLHLYFLPQLIAKVLPVADFFK